MIFSSRWCGLWTPSDCTFRCDQQLWCCHENFDSAVWLWGHRNRLLPSPPRYFSGKRVMFPPHPFGKHLETGSSGWGKWMKNEENLVRWLTPTEVRSRGRSHKVGVSFYQTLTPKFIWWPARIWWCVFFSNILFVYTFITLFGMIGPYFNIFHQLFGSIFKCSTPGLPGHILRKLCHNDKTDDLLNSIAPFNMAMVMRAVVNLRSKQFFHEDGTKIGSQEWELFWEMEMNGAGLEKLILNNFPLQPGRGSGRNHASSIAGNAWHGQTCGNKAVGSTESGLFK